LLDRLKEGTYGDIYNYNPKVFEKIMEDQEVEEEGEEEDDEEMDESAFIFDPNEVADSDEESEVELNMAKDSFEDFEDTFKPTKTGKAGKDKKKIPKTFGERVQKKVKPSPAVEIEYENEFEKATEDA
jgi:hypothetical protein